MSELNNDIVGKSIQDYKILKPLGQGKFSTVYQAQRQSDLKLVALKIIKVIYLFKTDIRYDGSEAEREMSTRG
jgi:serine/threonine protein kinase